MKTHTLFPYMLLAATALLFLLISQGVWVVSTVQQEKEARNAMFQECFNKAISFAIYESELTQPLIELVPTAKEEGAEIVLKATTSVHYIPGDIGKMLENVLLITKIEAGSIRMPYLNSVIQDCLKDLDKVISARLALYAYNEAIDRSVYTSNLTKKVFSDTYIAERVMVGADKQYTIRAEYQIVPQGYLLRTQSAIAVSVLASVFIGIALFSNRFIRRRNNDVPVHTAYLRQIGNAALDLRNQALICENEKIKCLRLMEYVVFKKLIDNFGQTVTRKELMVTIWGDQEENYSEHSMNNCIYRVRSLLKNDTNLEIGVNRKLGYKLVVGE